jgi:thiamine biosynthesis lipoprotein
MSDHVDLNAPVARVVREIFGSVASLAVVGPLREVGVEAAFARLDEIDARLSPYRIDSEVSRIRDGALAPAEAHPETRWILAACEALREESGGLFDARIAGVDGRLDPSGYVKGWAIGEAHRILIAAGMENCAFGIGGDVAASGEGPGGAGWVVGIADPRDRTSALASVRLRNAAIATSGESERPGHLRAPSGGVALSPFASFSVIGPAIDRVDALATIGWLEGAAGIERIYAEEGYGALAIYHDGRAVATEAFRSIAI